LKPGQNYVIELFSLFVQCKELLDGLLEHGRLTLKQMVERAKNMVEREKSSKREGESLVNV
jgi:hypothetical protein